MSFEDILLYLTTKQAIAIYAIICVSTFIENIFPPWPSDTIILAGAFLAGSGEVGYIPIHISATVGGLAGAMVLYYLGYTRGRSVFAKYNKSYFKPENLDKIERWFTRWGDSILIISRFLAGIRSVIAIAAGIGKVRALRMTILSLISFILWYLFLVGGMYLVKSNWQKLVEIIKQFHILLVIISVTIIFVWLANMYRKNRMGK